MFGLSYQLPALYPIALAHKFGQNERVPFPGCA